MSQRRTAPRSEPEGSCLGRFGLSWLWDCTSPFVAHCRQWLACLSAMLTMVIVGTIDGWTTISLPYLISGTGGVPMTLTLDESSWIVSLTILGSMTGSLVAAQLADRGGRKYCLLVCSTMCTFGWFIIYDTNSVSVLYLARVILGIGVGIARTINPMYVSEIADLDVRACLGTLIAVNVYAGSLVTCALGIWLTYKTLLVVLIMISFTSILTNTCFPETPYFLVAKGQQKRACKSIAYYKGIVDPERVKIELRALRAQTKYELHPKFRYELHQQSRSDVPSQSRRDLSPQSSSDLPSQPRSDLPSQARSDLPSQSRRDLSPQSSSDLPSQPRSDLPSQARSDLPSQPRSDLPSQSRREGHSDSFWEVVDTEAMSDSNLPSSSDSPSQSTSVIHSKVICEVHPQPTSELHLQSSHELHSQSASELHRPSASELHLPSASKMHRSSTSAIHQPSTRQIHRSSTSEIHRPSTSQIHRPSTSQIDQPTTSQINQPPASQIDQPSASQIGQPSAREMNQPSRNEENPDLICEIQSRSRSDLRIQSNVDSRELTDIDEIYMDGTKYTCITKLQVILHQSNRKALFIMLGLIMAQQLSGNFITTQYLEVLFDKTTIDIDPQEASVLVQLFSLVSGTLTLLTVEFVGRRIFLIISTGGLSLTLTILATYLLLIEHQFDVSIVSIIPVIDLIIYQVVFQIGLGTLSNVLLCDLFPTELKGFVGAIIVIFDGIIGITVSKLYQVITDNVGSYAIYFIFAISCISAFIAVLLWLPETKGKTYHEIEAILAGENLNSLNEEDRTDETDIRRI